MKKLVNKHSVMFRIWRTFFTAAIVAALFVLLLFVNLLQLSAFILIKPFSLRLFVEINRFFAINYWYLYVIWLEKLYGCEIVFSGDRLPVGENVIFMLNHQNIADAPLLISLAWRKRRLGDLKFFVKNVVKWLPGPGWGLYFLGTLYVKRDWLKDKEYIKRTFQRIIDHNLPFWLVSFLEGTRITRQKLARSQEYARKKGLKILNHLLIPRTKGFVASVNALRGKIDAVYDGTIIYPDGVPYLWQFMMGIVPRVHFHVKRYPISEIPRIDSEIASWVMKRFEEKDQMLSDFYCRDILPSPIVHNPLTISPDMFLGIKY
ncbi:MAG: acyltransferase [Oligoflexales bacterium]|nr:acyltransferase [Oligoflexales bacterium]